MGHNMSGPTLFFLFNKKTSFKFNFTFISRFYWNSCTWLNLLIKFFMGQICKMFRSNRVELSKKLICLDFVSHEEVLFLYQNLFSYRSIWYSYIQHIIKPISSSDVVHKIHYQLFEQMIHYSCLMQYYESLELRESH